MKTESSTLRITRKLSAAVEANRFVTFAGGVAAAGGTAAGPAYVKGAANDYVAVTVLGVAVAEAGAAISAGAELQVGADGKVITRTTGKTVAWAMEDAAADGDELSVFLVPNHT